MSRMKQKDERVNVIDHKKVTSKFHGNAEIGLEQGGGGGRGMKCDYHESVAPKVGMIYATSTSFPRPPPSTSSEMKRKHDTKTIAMKARGGSSSLHDILQANKAFRHAFLTLL